MIDKEISFMFLVIILGISSIIAFLAFIIDGTSWTLFRYLVIAIPIGYIAYKMHKSLDNC